jgi:hypothetical protein
MSSQGNYIPYSRQVFSAYNQNQNSDSRRRRNETFQSKGLYQSSETSQGNSGAFCRFHYHRGHFLRHPSHKCGKALAGVQPNRYSCLRQYPANGHWETLLKLNMRNKTSGNLQTEWAYAPYIAVSKYPPGPKVAETLFSIISA